MAVQDVLSLLEEMLKDVPDTKAVDGFFVGVDTGATGAVAIQLRGLDVRASVVLDMPTTKVEGSGKSRGYSMPDYAVNSAICRMVSEDAARRKIPVFATVEAITAGQGPGGPPVSKSTVLRMGVSFSCWPQAFDYADFSYSVVHPSSWKAKLKVPRDKEKSRQHAVKTFPMAKRWFLRKSDHNRAEAFLLSEYARLLHEEN